MRRGHTIKSTLIFLICLSLSVFAQSGIEVIQKNTSPNDPEENGSTTISFTKDKVIFESKSSINHNIFLFEANAKKMTNADFKQGVYMELTSADVKKMGEMRKQAMPQLNNYQDLIKQKMEEAKQNMSEEDRKKFEQYTAQHGSPIPGMSGGDAASEKTQFEKMESGVTVGKWSGATHYVGHKGGKKAEEVWTVSPDKLGVTNDDLVIFRKLADFMGNMGGDIADKINASFQIGSAEFEKENGYAGVPIKGIDYSMYGEVENIDETESVNRKTFGPETFQIPNKDKLKKQDIMGGMPDFKRP